MSELSESMHALRRAAGHLAHGTAERLSPTYDRARHLAGRGLESTRQTVSPMYRQARESAMSARSRRRHKKEAHKRGRMRTLRGLLLTGAAVGAASAAVARRRRQQAEWAEYEQMGGFDESRYAEGKAGERSAKQKMASGAASMADSLSARAGRIADSLHERSAGMQEKAGQHREGEASTVPLRESAPSMPGPGPVGTPSTMNTSPAGRERLGDPALDFPSER